jgi:hypothetical protein
MFFAFKVYKTDCPIMGELVHLPGNKEARHENQKLSRLSKTGRSEDAKHMNGGLSW